MSKIQLVSRPNRSFLGFTIAAVISFALHVAGAATEATEAASELQGRWSGTIQIPGHELVLVVDLAGELERLRDFAGIKCERRPINRHQDRGG